MMPNHNRNYSLSEFDSILEKYGELIEVRKEVELLTGEVVHSRIIDELKRRRDCERFAACPPHMYLGLTPNKQQVVKDSWNHEVRSLKSLGIREEALSYLVAQMREQDSIEKVREYIQERKNNVLDPKEEKTFQKRFN